MASAGLLAITAVMGVLLVGAAYATSRLSQRGSYRPALAAAGIGAQTDSDGGVVTSDEFALALAALLVVLVGAAVALGNGTLVLYAVVPLLIVAYFTWGVYHMARARGLPKAHSVGVSAWLFGVLVVGVVALNLVFA